MRSTGTSGSCSRPCSAAARPAGHDWRGDPRRRGAASLRARPARRNASIHLLSGGEKALTALALVFSMFQLNPAPFCLLDEVDAPLDDTNTERFCDLVRRMAQHTQFLFISHNKITMEMAEQLVGMTMPEQGVSQSGGGRYRRGAADHRRGHGSLNGPWTHGPAACIRSTD